ncbi:hypothetical protein TrLO_g8716 [Triparma laevis f. longispina]|uniref:Uncharacterized protein n=1 Tax=Triparma laevis f. longispina TaxID=1714387 RepID=A0A9W6ZZJ7_9STRA|nr:hypothetical protein TrLO_g8716 [Triparma laevis f. longispina]
MSIKLLAITTLLVCLAMTKSLLPTFAIKTVTATTANSATNSAKADLRLLLAGRGVGLEGKEEVIGCLSTLRRARAEGEENGFNEYVDELLELVDARRGGFTKLFSRAPLALNVPSFRVNLLLLRRVMELTDTSVEVAARRNTLAIILSQLKTTKGGVAGLLREAERRTRNAVSMEEMISRTPEGLETPKYKVVERFEGEGWEIREYNDYALCSTRNVEGFSGFQTLAGYIFGKNVENRTMAMTTPVFMSPDKMSFVMPSDYWGDEAKLKNEAPTPLATSDVEKEAVGKKLVAALWFGGVSTKKISERRKAELQNFLDGCGGFGVGDGDGDDAFLVASYNDPFTAPWKRRNEILANVQRKK